ncbi:MAG TPA: NAD-dependent epimerase/dehydratase family protein [Chloroflexota bacterium]|nr:NAD-dependent epimerase/dehydratase family protein [Chloroflexota bacterium]
MRVALTGAGSDLGRAIAASLGDGHDVVAVDDALAASLTAGEPMAFPEGCAVVVHAAMHPAWWPGAAARDDSAALDWCGRGTYALLTAALAAGVKRIVLASTLALFEAYPAGWRIQEGWKPRPSTALVELGPYVAEVSAREVARARDVAVVCLRLERLAGLEDGGTLPVGEAAASIVSALTDDAARGARGGWRAVHVGSPADPRPARSMVGDDGRLRPTVWTAPRDIQRVSVFGAGGPVGAAAAPHLAEAYTLRLTDLLSADESAASVSERFPHAPVPADLGAPHAWERVDVSDWEAVRAAARGADALANFTVNRTHAVYAFKVNTLGAYHVVRAAAELGIRRVIHTGPQILNHDHPAGYGADYDLPDEAPPRPGDNLYFHAKLLGYEVCRVFAEQCDLELIALLFSTFVDPERPGRMAGRLGPAAVGWDDAGRAVRAALDVKSLPTCFEPVRVLGDLPHGKYSNAKARRVLGWEPRQSLAHLWKNG